MKTLVLALVLLASPLFTSAQETQAQFQDRLSHATLGVYHGEQKCAWVSEHVWIFSFLEWQCKFEEHFTCTATVIAAVPLNASSGYIAITAGHCFDWKELDKYYVADGVYDKPVMHKIIVQKFENDARYDYALITFESRADYPTIELEKMDADGPAIGTEVMNVNFSLGVVKQFTEGKVISEVVKSTEGGDCDMCKGRYLVSIGIGPGASGSSVVDAHTHKIVGFAEAVFPGTQMPSVVIPAGKRLADFMDDDSAGIKPLPEGPKPKEDAPTLEHMTLFQRFLHWITRLL